MKETKRKGFNFFRSYYDVYNELNDKDKVAFMNALLDRQFLGIKPTNLEGMAKFAYISQTNSIDSQVKGYEHKTNTRLNEELNTPTVGGRQGGNDTPTVQVEEKEKEKEEVQYVVSSPKAKIDFDSLLTYINSKTGRNFKVINNKVKSKYKARLKDGYDKKDIISAINNSVETKFHKDNGFNFLTPEFFSRAETIDKYATKTKTKSVSVTKEIKYQENPYKNQL